jgi:putative tricarboxylic transport membrane protein
MAFVLGPMAENAVRQSLVLSDNNPLIFVERPISATIFGAAVLIGLFLLVTSRRRRSVQSAVLAGQPAPLVEAKGE